MVRLQKNEIYTVGKVPTVNCKEPSIKPTSRSAILKYYNALLPCLNRAWQPLVKKAGYPFRPPKLQLVTKNTSSCLGTTDRSFYCGADETISMQWQDTPKTYRQNALATRVVMMDTLAHEYAHHVQHLTNILISSESREGWTKSNAAKLEWNRRLELQASCFAAAFLGANKQGLGFRGEKLRFWEYMVQHSGDEYDEKKVRDHGSRKNQWLWGGAAFKSGSPASCNTYTAPSTKVS
jgi:predicted metalloprotease